MIRELNRRAVACALLVVASGLVVPRSSFAQPTHDTVTAEALFEEAKALMAEGKDAEACPKLEESQRLDPASGTLLNLAGCYEKVGRLASAWSTYAEAGTAAKASGNAEREEVARTQAAALRPRLASLVIHVAPSMKVPGLEVTRDGQRVGAPQWEVALPVDEGEHKIEANAPGRLPWHGSILVTGEGSTAEVSVPALSVDPAIAEAAKAREVLHARESRFRARRTMALIAGGVGIVGLSVGTLFAIKSKSDHDEADQFCAGSVCRDQRGVDAGNAAYTAGTVSTVAMVVGVVGLGGATVLWLTAPRPTPASAKVGLGPGGLRIEGVW
ncbi:MAG: hypothetical protein JWM74_1337 [Myxococcaceae bacterium]|nr:hypothetical protein [Myxococcaceae bacterium]